MCITFSSNIDLYKIILTILKRFTANDIYNYKNINDIIFFYMIGIGSSSNIEGFEDK